MLSRRALLALRSPPASHCGRPFSSTSAHLSGHNKWSKIKQRKGISDANKSLVYGRATRDILVAVRNGGSAPDRNIALANALKKAKADGVPKATIEGALAKASGRGAAGEAAVYEAMAHGSVGVLIECMTDNANRTVMQLREVLKAHSASFATVAFMFQRRGVVHVTLPAHSSSAARFDSPEKWLETVVDTALEAGAEDFDTWTVPEEGAHAEFFCAPTNLGLLTDAATAPALGTELEKSELVYAPSDVAAAGENDDGLDERIAELVQQLEENEDTLRVWTTLDSPSSNPEA
ncbi:YebC-like protein [Auriscalpium vulgare]|uniref:YebC-like protein n=1 Tax=Auriscalpium vulgare TaxID=40419 RepID=A0ACB8RD91_9AGAM|nr:YebC-like protein [Auriscalpium vulgare]